MLLILDYARSSQWALWEQAALLGIELHVVATLETPISPTIVFEPEIPRFGTFHELKLRRHRGDRRAWWRYRGLDRVTQSVQPDLVHVRTEPWSLLTGQVLGAGRPTIVHGAETLYEQGGVIEREFRRIAARRNLRRVRGFVGWNTAAVAAARCAGLPAKAPVSVVPAELPDPLTFREARARRDATRRELGLGSEFVVGFVGRYAPEKGLCCLVDAFERATLPNSVLACFGAGPDATIREAERRSDGRVREFGAVPRSEIPRTMAALDVLVVPSITLPSSAEQFGRVAVEGMLAGTPLIVSRSGALPEVVCDGGLVVDEADVRGLASALTDLAASPERRDEVGSRGRARALREYKPSAMAERLVSMWERATPELAGR